MDLSNKIIMITGASGGIGAAACRACLEYGATVIAAGPHMYKLENLVGTLKDLGSIYPYEVDATNRSQVREVVAQIIADHGRIDGLFNNAGSNRKNPLLDVVEEDFDFIMNLNVKGAFNVASEVAGYMKEAGHGRIVNVSSIAGISPEHGNGIYCMSKAAVSMMTQVMSVEWSEFGISVVALAPGKVMTSLVEQGLHRLADSYGMTFDELKEKTIQEIPAGRIMDPSEVGFAVAFLFDERSYYMMGNSILMSGGVVTH